MDEIMDLTLLHLFHQCSHLLHTGGKCRGQGRLLVLLLEHGTLTQRALADITGRRPATLSEQLDNMEHSGYITRARNAQDHRNVDVSLTSLGSKAALDAKKRRAERAKKLFSTLNDQEKQELFLLLSRLSDTWTVFSQESEVDSP